MFSIVKYDQVFLKSELDQYPAKDVLMQHSVFFKSGREILTPYYHELRSELHT